MPNQFTTLAAFITCETCGTAKRVKPYKIGTARFCSRACLGLERSIKRGTIPGAWSTPEYRSWVGMIARCRNLGNQFYGQRGISVCDAWRLFDRFLADMGPSNGLTLERMDVNLGYSKENCRWATWAVQARNKRTTVYLTANGETRPRVEWAELLGINPRTLKARLRYGWSTERALGLESQHDPNPLPAGETQRR